MCKENKLNDKFIASTVVSTPMMDKISELNNIKFFKSLTGFKWIGKMINDYPEMKFIGGGEESFGYLIGDFVRDKDAITSSLLACEICSELKMCSTVAKRCIQFPPGKCMIFFTCK